MEHLITFFLSINKLSFLVFLIGLFLLIYEFYLIMQERKKKSKPEIPQFKVQDQNNKPSQHIVQNVVSRDKGILAHINIHFVLVALLMIMTIFFFTLSLMGMNKNKEDKKKTSSVIVYSEAQSEGVKIFTKNLVKELTEEDIATLSAGTVITIGIKTINETDIDRARIKVNESDWSIKHITTNFDKVKKMYYTEYNIATGESKLSIDAQLHSFSEGWLGD